MYARGLPGAGALGGGAAVGAAGVAETPEIHSPVLPDTVQSIDWSPAGTGDLIASGSWDGKVRLWQVSRAPTSAPAAITPAVEFDAGSPVLDTAWSHDASTVFGVGCSCLVRMWNVSTKTPTDIGKHDAPIRGASWVAEKGALVTGSWDKTLRYWDTRSPTAAVTVPLGERVYSMDVKYPLMVVALANRQIILFDLSANLQTPLRALESPLKMQTRCVRAFYDRQYFGVTSIEGRCAIRCVDAALEPLMDADGKTKHHFAFKCHRDGAIAYQTNFVDNQPSPDFQSVFSTVGGDGVINFWDRNRRTRLRELRVAKYPITIGVWNPAGDLFAYALGYDWARGIEYNNANEMQNKLCIHHTTVAGDFKRAKAQ